MEDRQCYFLALKYGFSRKEARDFNRMTEEERLIYLFSRLNEAKNALRRNTSQFESEIEAIKKKARREIRRLM